MVCIVSTDKSVLASGSLVAKDPIHSPLMRDGKYWSRSSGFARSSVLPTRIAWPSYKAEARPGE